jgi:prepilin-type N-terminal cleavage/methylation domain-containing protein
MPSHKATGPRGYTLLELIVVMALIGIVFFFAVPRFEGTWLTDDAQKSSRWLIAKLRLLREESLRTHRLLTLHIDLDTSRIWETDEAMSLEERDAALRRSQPIPGGARIAGVSFPVMGRVASGRADIRFHRDGHSDWALIHLQSGETRYAFLLEPFLQEVKMFEGFIGFEDLR